MTHEYRNKIGQESLLCRIRWFFDDDVHSDRFFETALNYSKDGERVFYHNVVFDTKADPDDPEFNIICTYSSKYVKLVFRAHGVGYHKPVPRQAFKRPMGEHYQVFLDRSRKDS